MMNGRVVPDVPDPEFEEWLGGSFETWLPSKRAVAFRSVGREYIAHAGDYVFLKEGAFHVEPGPSGDEE